MTAIHCVLQYDTIHICSCCQVRSVCVRGVVCQKQFSGEERRATDSARDTVLPTVPTLVTRTPAHDASGLTCSPPPIPYCSMRRCRQATGPPRRSPAPPSLSPFPMTPALHPLSTSQNVQVHTPRPCSDCREGHLQCAAPNEHRREGGLVGMVVGSVGLGTYMYVSYTVL